jgi:hypothetical protein
MIVVVSLRKTSLHIQVYDYVRILAVACIVHVYAEILSVVPCVVVVA